MLELRLTLALVAVLIVPGWAILSLAPHWKHDAPLVRWCLAISISIAFYPVLFYATRALVPAFQWGPNKLAILLVAGVTIIGWKLRGTWQQQFAFGQLEWIALAIFGMTLFTRFWIIRDHPYPAWTDSFHHTLLTLLTANAGRLPYDMQPYFPVPLGEYHLGLYALSGTLEMLTNAPAHTALLWMAQALNGLCGLGVYLVLDRRVGRCGAMVGAAAVGLFSFQPAWYVNWGRFTQVASQTIVLSAWVVTWDALQSWKLEWGEHRTEIIWNSAVAALLGAGVFLLHFRVAGFYLPLVAIIVVWELFQSRREKMMPRVLLGITTVGIGSLLLISPALWEALRIYLSATLKAPFVSDEAITQASGYWVFPWDSIFTIGVEPWLLTLACIGAVIGLLRRDLLVGMTLCWLGLLVVIGNVYMFRIAPLIFTNLGAVLIALYLPIGLFLGAGAECALDWVSAELRLRMVNRVIAALLALGFVASHIRANAIEEWRYLVTPADAAAMEWIKSNTPSDARFAINTWFWLPTFPHGTDAGFWITYFTGRGTNTSSMLLQLASNSEVEHSAAMSKAVKQLNQDPNAVTELHQFGMDYIYIGTKGNFAEPGLGAVRWNQSVSVVYQQNGVTILKLEHGK